MRHLFLIASSLAALAAPGVASAACSPAFVGTGETVNLTGLSIGTGEVKREEFNLRVRNLDGGEELFDLAADPTESENLAAVPERREDLERLRALLE